MRQPTADPLAWWRRAIRDPLAPRHEGHPQAGFYRTRKVKGGPYVPVAIVLIQNLDESGELSEPERFEADELGKPVDPLWIWDSCQPISLDDYHALQDMHNSDTQMAATHAEIDLSLKPARPRR